VKRAAIALSVLLALTAFAPAPLPRRERGSAADEMSLSHFQGYWRMVHFDEGNAQVKGVRVQGDRWAYVNQNGSDNARYRLVVGKGRGAVPIDWYHGTEQQQPYFLGLIRRDGDKLELLYRVGARREERPAGIIEPKPQGWLVMVLERER
jgi:hypothetical protein